MAFWDNIRVRLALSLFKKMVSLEFSVSRQKGGNRKKAEQMLKELMAKKSTKIMAILAIAVPAFLKILFFIYSVFSSSS